MLSNTTTCVIKVKPGLTRQIINLQHQGYCHDFVKLTNNNFLCLTTGQEFTAPEVEITVLNQIFDPQKKQCAYLHSIDTAVGLKGLLLIDSLCFNTTAY
ncbi:hypothetical protein [Mucilaginibacter phyllosphaerae]